MSSENRLYSEIKQILEQARNNAIRAVNFSMVIAYWEIGKRIVEQEQQGKRKAEYGNALLIELSKKLTTDFGNGFSLTNLKYIRQFYVLFSSQLISHAASDQIKVADINKNKLASKYKLYLPTEKELIKELQAEIQAIKLQKKSNSIKNRL